SPRLCLRFALGGYCHRLLPLSAERKRVMLHHPAATVASAILRMSWVIRIEQNFGPHIEQNFADLKTSCGNVSSCIARAVSGSSDSSNWRFQSNSKRALDSSSSRRRAFLRPRAMSPAWAAILYAITPWRTSSLFGKPRCSFGVTYHSMPAPPPPPTPAPLATL